jgi:poly-gamma-glutamate capsule biosynthesis protein CapA/YwtB (metallophosphatase superfamily)
MALRLALAGDTMLGRGVAERLRGDPRAPLVAPEVAEAVASADLFVLNLECCISERGERLPDPHKRFFFRAPPVAAERLAELGVDAVTLANNHALDYGPVALLDTLDHLDRAGIAHVGAGADADAARAPATIGADAVRLRVVAASDHPADCAAGPGRPGIAYADLRRGEVPVWLLDSARPDAWASAVLVTPHWGPNMRAEPLARVRRAAAALVAAGATLVAGHSAHVFQGGRSRAAQRPRTAVAGHVRRPRPATPRGPAADARALQHPSGHRRRREVGDAPLPGAVRTAGHRGPRGGGPLRGQPVLISPPRRRRATT